MNCNNKKPIVIYKGYSTNWNGENLLILKFKSSFDLENFSAELSIGSIKKTINDLTVPYILNLTAEETDSFEAGNLFGELVVSDAYGVQKLFSTCIPFYVKNGVCGNVELDNFTIEVNAVVGSENVLSFEITNNVSVQVGQTETLPSGENAYVQNVGSQNGLILNFGIPRGEDGKINGISNANLVGGQDIDVNVAGNNIILDFNNESGFATEQQLNELSDETDVIKTDLGDLGDQVIDVQNKVVQVESIAKNATQALAFNNYSSLIDDLNLSGKDLYNVGQSFYIKTLNVPDLWIFSIEENSIAYTYISDEQFINDVNNSGGSLQIGFYKVSFLETQKVDLTDYVTTDTQQDISALKNFTDGLQSGGNDVITTADFATTEKAGIIRPSATYGLTAGNNGIVYIVSPSYDQIKAETSPYMPITCIRYRYAVENVMAKTSETALTIADSAITLTANIPEYTLTAGENFTINVPTVVANRAFHFCIHANITTDIVITFPTGAKAYNGVPPYFTAGDWDIIVDYENGVWKYGAIKAE